MSLSSSISDLMNTNKEPYTASAAIADGVLDPTSSTVTGDRSGDLFTAKNELGKDDFLTLLVTQLQYQDPLSPMENTEFIAQLAQFSALESNTNIEKAIDNLGGSFQDTVAAQFSSSLAVTNASAVSLIGKEVRLMEKTVHHSGNPGDESSIRIHLGNDDEAVLNILNEDGEIIRSLRTQGKDGENSTMVVWNGLGDDGMPVREGTYDIAFEGQEEKPWLYAFAQNVVQGVRFAEDGAKVKMDGKELSIANIMDVSTGGEGSSNYGGLSTSSAVNLLGKQVRFGVETVEYTAQANEVIEIKADLGGESSAVVGIFNQQGELVQQFEVIAGLDGTTSISWDGKTMDGKTFAPKGNYAIQITGSSEDFSGYCFNEGIVDGITNITNGTQLRVNGEIISLSSILDIATETVQEEAA